MPSPDRADGRTGRASSVERSGLAVGRLAIVALIGLWVLPAGALPIVYTSQGAELFRFEAPDEWTVRTGIDVPTEAMPAGAVPAPRIVSLMPPESPGVMWVGLWSPPGVTDLAAADAYLRSLRGRFLDEATLEEPSPRTIGGRPAAVYRGAGLRDGRSLRLQLAVVQVTSARIAVIAFVGEPTAWDVHDDTLRAVAASIRPVAGGVR